MNKILIGSPVRQKNSILQQFLLGLEEVEKGDNEVSYFFVDDNTDEASSNMLDAFSKDKQNVLIQKGNDIISETIDSEYICDNSTHYWNSENIQRITLFKDHIIEYAIENDFDYIFLIDSDIVLFRKSLLHLLSRNVEIVSNVFWTQWHVNDQLIPQCFWIPDVYQQNKAFNVPLSAIEAERIKTDMYKKLSIPGIYRVDGLGACTLINRSALKKGVRFQAIPNLSIHGEDRHFCIRAGALGIELYMDTVYPAYHIFREEYLNRVTEFKEEGFKFDMCQSYIVCEAEKNKKKKSPFFIKALKRINRGIKKIVADR